MPVRWCGGLVPVTLAVTLELPDLGVLHETCPVGVAGPAPAGATGLIRSLTTR